ncbi:MAG: 4-hydroxy-tetrahydrodipicolinate synthase [Oscillospiraceae bacterium]
MNKTLPFKGSAVAIITPFDKNGEINFDKLSELIEMQIENQTDAIVICGTTGESATLSDSEKISLYKFAVEVTAKRIPVIAGTGSNSTAHSIELSKCAEQCRCDSLLVVTPYYNKASQIGLVEHFNKIADNTNLPIILYNVPSRTGVNIAVDTYVKLSKHRNIVAVKEASGDISHIAKVAQACENSLYLYSGNDDQNIPILSLGGKGVISVLANVLPKETHNICKLWFEGEQDEARKMHFKLLKFMNNLFIDVNPIPVKEALNLLGLDVGGYRLPLTSMSAENVEILQESMRKINLI